MHNTTAHSSDLLNLSNASRQDKVSAVTSADQEKAADHPGSPPSLPDATPSPLSPPTSRNIALAVGTLAGRDEPLRQPGTGPHTAWGREVRLPSGPYGFEDTGRPIFAEFARRESLFIQHRTVVERALNHTTGCDELKAVTPSEFRSRLEGLGQLVAYRSDNKSRWSWRPSLCSEDNAKGLLGSKAATDLLPRISTVVSCPIAVAGPDGKLKILDRGYHPEFGGTLITKGNPVPIVPLKEASDRLWDLMADYVFVTRSDASRAFAAMLAPALALGGLLGNARIPVDLAIASSSQSGKTFRQRLVAAIYGESPYVIAQRAKGVGGLDESIGHGLLSGRPFLQLDNLRGSLDSPYLEAFMTAEYIGVRVPHRAETLVKTNRYVMMITSNDLVATPDLIKRSSIIRIVKRPREFKYKLYDGLDVLDHVRANQSYYLGCVFSVLDAWYAKGCPRTEETGHDFRAWVGACDYIVQHLAGFAPLLEDYDTNLQTLDGTGPAADPTMDFWKAGNTLEQKY